MTAPELAVMIDEWQAAYNAFFVALENLPAETRELSGLCGEWNARQVVAHLAGWHAITLQRFAEFAAGGALNVSYDTDSTNRELVAARAHLNYDQTISDLRSSLDAVSAIVHSLLAAGDPVDPRYGEWLRGLAKDARLHTKQIEVWTG